MRWTTAIVSVAAISVLGQSALADGMPSLKDPPIVPVAPVCAWGGTYVGVDTGTTITNTHWRFPQDEVDTLGGGQRIAREYFDYQRGDRFDVNRRAWTYSGHIGVNIPINPQLIAGIEIAYTNGDLDKRTTSPFDRNDTFRTQINHLTEVKGRLGYAMGCWLPYVKAGYAIGRVQTSAQGITTLTRSTVSTSTTESNWQDGYTLGGGLEYMLTRNWVIGFEYDWVNLGRERTRTPVVYRNGVNTGQTGSTLVRDVDIDAHILSLRLNYKF